MAIPGVPGSVTRAAVADVERPPGGTFLGDDVIRSYREACRLWPVESASPGRSRTPCTGSSTTGHGAFNRCTVTLVERLLEDGSRENVDPSSVTAVPPRFRMSDR